jgi:DNA ligase 1
MTIIKESPTYISKAKKGNDKFWRIAVLEKGTSYYTRQEYWQTTNDGTDSVHQFSEPKLITPKNVGKKNETSPLAQALSEMESTILRYKDKGYHLEGEDAATLILPMLAMEYSKRKAVNKVTWPMYGQPKLDGARCLYSNKTGFYSRMGKPFLAEVTAHIHRPSIKDSYILDGELILLRPYTFQDTMKAIKKFREDLSPQLVYVTYDVIDTENLDMPFIERLDLLDHIHSIFLSRSMVTCKTETLVDEEDMLKYHTEIIRLGFEGTMLRDPNSTYSINHRSAGLLKYKDFLDDDFEITNVVSGVAKFKDCGIFECRTKDGQIFSVTPQGTLEEKQEYLKKSKELIGQLLKVKYQNLSEDGIPRFPVGIGIRDKNVEG